MSKTIAIIPARGNSKRLPNKNIKLLCGKPLIAYSILYAKANSFIDDVYVSTDSRTIKKVAIEYGAKVIDRPKELSGDLEPTVTALKHVLNSINEMVDNIVLLQPTNPLRPKYLLSEAFHIYKEEDVDALFTVSRSYHKLGKVNDDKFKPFNYTVGQRSQDLEPLFYENGLLYIIKSKLIKKEIIISKNAYALKVEHPFSAVDIDDINDFEYAEFLYNKYFKQ